MSEQDDDGLLELNEGEMDDEELLDAYDVQMAAAQTPDSNPYAVLYAGDFRDEILRRLKMVID